MSFLLLEVAERLKKKQLDMLICKKKKSEKTVPSFKDKMGQN